MKVKLTKTIEAIIRSCPSLENPQYIPTFWSSNKWANLALYFLKQLYDKSSWQSNNFTREVLSLPDGGTVSVDFADDSHLPSDSPVVLFLHTITGSGLVSQEEADAFLIIFSFNSGGRSLHEVRDLARLEELCT